MEIAFLTVDGIAIAVNDDDGTLGGDVDGEKEIEGEDYVVSELHVC